MNSRIESIDRVRGLAMLLMALDHVRMYFAHGTWYADPTDLAATTPLLFFTRWITHICAPTFVFLAGTSAFLSGARRANAAERARFLFVRGLWLIFAELAIVNFAWTFDATYSFVILQVLWAIGISMLVLSGLVFLPKSAILLIGLVLVFGHNLLDGVNNQGDAFSDLLWYTLHQPQIVELGGRLVNFVYPVLPWIGLMAVAYVCGSLYEPGFAAERRVRWLWMAGGGAILLFLVLRAFSLYGEPNVWQFQSTPVYSLLSFLNTTKYPPSLQFLLMTIGPVLLLLAASETWKLRVLVSGSTFGKVPFFFYVVHLFMIHALAMAWLKLAEGEWSDYVLSAEALRSGKLAELGFDLGIVYLIWIGVILLLYPVCAWYARFKASHRDDRWVGFF